MALEPSMLPDNMAPTMPIWFMVLLALAGLTGLAGLAVTATGMGKPPGRRQQYFAIGVSLSLLGAAAFFAMLVRA